MDTEEPQWATGAIKGLSGTRTFTRHKIFKGEVIKMVTPAPAKEKLLKSIHTCHYCGHTGPDVNLIAHVYIGGHGDMEYPCCDDVEACIARVKNV